MFAVCEELNERIILTADTVNKLELLQQYNVVYVPETVIAMTSPVVDDVDDQSDSSEDDVIPIYICITSYIGTTIYDVICYTNLTQGNSVHFEAAR